MLPCLIFSIISKGSRVKWRSLLHLGLVAIEKEAVGSHSTKVANFTYYIFVVISCRFFLSVFLRCIVALVFVYLKQEQLTFAGCHLNHSCRLLRGPLADPDTQISHVCPTLIFDCDLSFFMGSLLWLLPDSMLQNGSVRYVFDM